MTLVETIDHDIKEAMKARAALKLGVLRMLKSSLKLVTIEKLGADGQLPDTDALAIVRKEMKKRQDSIEAFVGGGREDLAEKERSEAAILATYLPKALDPAEIESLIREAITEAGAASKKDMGAVMKIASAKAAGRIDGKTLSQTVQSLLP